MPRTICTAVRGCVRAKHGVNLLTCYSAIAIGIVDDEGVFKEVLERDWSLRVPLKRLC